MQVVLDDRGGTSPAFLVEGVDLLGEIALVGGCDAEVLEETHQMLVG